MPDTWILEQQQRNKIYKKTLKKKGRHLHLQCKLFTAQEKSVMWQLSRQSFSRHQLNRKKILWNFFKKSSKSPLKLKRKTHALAIYNENCLQHKKNPLWQFSRQNLSEQTENQRFNFRIFFSNSLIWKNKVRPRLTPQILGYKGNLFTSRPRGSNLERY